MSDLETRIWDILQKSFISDELHYEFDIPTDQKEYSDLMTALKSLEKQCKILILESPDDGSDMLLVEKYPPNCRPLIDTEN